MDQEITYEIKQDGIAPFWKKLPFFLLFPFRLSPFIFMTCIVAASAAAGFFLGGMGLVFKGFLAYIGLRYAFNVLELFSQGKFEGESVDHTLWGPEKRPAKLGMIILLYLAIAVSLGNLQVARKIEKDAVTQEKLLQVYKKDHAEAIAERKRSAEEYKQEMEAAKAARSNQHVSHPSIGSEEGADAAYPSDSQEDASHGNAGEPNAAEEPPAFVSEDYIQYGGMSRADIFANYKPRPADALWMSSQPAWYWALMALLSLLLPAAAIVIALEDKFFKALNPMHAVYCIKSMGSAYFALWFFFLLIAGARQLSLTAGGSMPTALGFPLEMAVATYLGLVLFAMMGYALYQFHQELGLHVAVDFDDHRRAGGAEAIAKEGSAHRAILAAEPKDPLERKVQGLVAEGKIGEAIAEVKDAMRYDRQDPELNGRLHALYALQGDAAVTMAHGQLWISALAKKEMASELFNAYSKLIAIDKEFVVEDADAILPLAKEAAKQRKYDMVLRLVKGFDRRFPKHKDMAGIFFIGAKTISEYQRQDEKAEKILRLVLTHFPDEPVAQEARQYLETLKAIGAKR